MDRQQQQQPATSAPDFSLTQVASPAPSGNDTPCNVACTCTDDIDKVLCDKKLTPPGRLASATAPSVPLRRRSNRNKVTSEIPQSPDPLGCGRCSKDGNCACIIEAAAAVYSVKRPISPSQNTPKRTRVTNYVDLTPAEELETDFTTPYMTKPPPAPSFSDAPVITQMPADPCGFCSDGTHCVCAEAAANSIMNMEDDTDPEEHHSTKLPPLLSNHTPPPLPPGDTRTHERPQLGKPMALHPPMTKSTVGLQSGCQPGGCAQCKNDPMSTLFCQSVATKVKSRPPGCCGGGCCGSTATPQQQGGSGKLPSSPSKEKIGGSDEKGTFIPCSAAYQALSRHRGFEEATADLGSLLRPLMVRSSDGRCPQIEVSSVRDVLKQLDRRFGSDAS